ncbi:MAG: sensor histidine kinase [Actinomycetota bacterium]
MNPIRRVVQALFGDAPPEREDPKTVELIATVSHEIRSPLTTIKGFTKTLIDRWDRLTDETKRDMLLAINADADRVTRLLTELLDVSRIEAGRLTLHQRPVDLRELAAETVEGLAGRSDRHVVRIGGDEVLEVMGDPDKLRQVVTNFVENALKYTDEGTVMVTCVHDNGWGRLAVTDEGPGIPDRRQRTLFDKFTRHEVPGSPSGTGLGLYICKGLIEAHGGRVGVTSAEGAGSTFWFEIALADVT